MLKRALRSVSFGIVGLSIVFAVGCSPTVGDGNANGNANGNTNTNGNMNDNGTGMTARDPLPMTTPTFLNNDMPRFRKTNLNFFISQFSTQAIAQDKQTTLITEAFQRWGAVTPLTFTQVTDRAQADLYLGFGRMFHCELYMPGGHMCPMDDVFPPGVLAHAYFPNEALKGELHMNDDVDYLDDRLLVSTLVHEIGHNLGLNHLTDMSSVMFSCDSGQTGDLQPADITAIQNVYGSADGTTRPAQRTAPPATDADVDQTAPTTDGTDTDGDGLEDSVELYVLGTDPNNADTDGDGVDDGVEAMLDLDPTNPDTDGDGVSDGDELAGDGNAYIPDLGLAGEDVSALVGTYAGTDDFDTPIEFTVEADGTVTGTLALTQYGFEEDCELIGEVAADGQLILVSYDYYFEYNGTIVGGEVTDGRFDSEDGEEGDWTASLVVNGAPRQSIEAFTATFKKDGSIQLTPLWRTDIGVYEPRGGRR